jgi:hypothetical protein
LALISLSSAAPLDLWVMSVTLSCQPASARARAMLLLSLPALWNRKLGRERSDAAHCRPLQNLQSEVLAWLHFLGWEAVDVQELVTEVDLHLAICTDDFRRVANNEDEDVLIRRLRARDHPPL